MKKIVLLALSLLLLTSAFVACDILGEPNKDNTVDMVQLQAALEARGYTVMDLEDMGGESTEIISAILARKSSGFVSDDGTSLYHTIIYYQMPGTDIASKYALDAVELMYREQLRQLREGHEIVDYSDVVEIASREVIRDESRLYEVSATSKRDLEAALAEVE